MPTLRAPRKGSLQFWPRKRASKFLPSVNWNVVPDSSKNLKGFIVYKAGMASAEVLDNSNNSLTKGKKIIIPVTILECPSLKIFSIRFYKNGKVMDEILNEKLDKDLIRIVKIPNKHSKKIEDIKDYDDIKVIVYSTPKKMGLKKTPDLAEIGLTGDLDSKLNYVKDKISKEISISEIFENGQIVDARGLTQGKGFQGTVKRFGIKLKFHKTEKGRRRPGTLGPWHPAHVGFRTPMAGQLGMFTRIVYNNKILKIGKAEDREKIPKLKNIKNYGNINTDYIIVAGSVQGTAKRQLLLTSPLRVTKNQSRKNYTMEELI